MGRIWAGNVIRFTAGAVGRRGAAAHGQRLYHGRQRGDERRHGEDSCHAAGQRPLLLCLGCVAVRLRPVRTRPAHDQVRDGVYRFDAYFTAGNAPEIRVNTVLRADYYPAYALAADGRIVTLNSAADAVPAGPAIDIDGMRTLTIDLNAMTYTLSRIAIANCMPDDAAAACRRRRSGPRTAA